MTKLKKLKLTASILRLVVVLSVLMFIGILGCYEWGTLSVGPALLRSTPFLVVAYICAKAERRIESLRREYIRKIHRNRGLAK